jgi:hypothetical protein
MAGAEPAFQEIIKIWKAKWTMMGWNAEVVSKPHATCHPFYHPLVSRVSTYRTSNGRNYETGCWVRWLAASKLADRLGQPIVVADSDVMPRDLKPADTKALSDPVHLLDRHGVPCLVYLTPEGGRKIVNWMMAYQPPADLTQVSDMMFFLQDLKDGNKVKHGPHWCYLYGDKNNPEWQNAKAWHFAAAACRGTGQHKLDTIKKCVV